MPSTPPPPPWLQTPTHPRQPKKMRRGFEETLQEAEKAEKAPKTSWSPPPSTGLLHPPYSKGPPLRQITTTGRHKKQY